MVIVLLSSFLIKAKDNLFLTRQSWAAYTDALNNLLSFILSSILMTKAPKIELKTEDAAHHTISRPPSGCSGGAQDPDKALHGGPCLTDKFNFIFLFGGYSVMHKLGFKSH